MPSAILKVLIVVDRLFQFQDGVNVEFSLEHVVRTLRKEPGWVNPQEYAFATFDLTLATRVGTQATNPAPAPLDPRFVGFRFDQPGLDLNQFDQIWCFGFDPLVSLQDGKDDPIAASPYALTDPEVAAIASWMEQRRGGVFAAGDHYLLGASLSSRIPRVKTMRRWTNAQSVPVVADPIAFDDPNDPGNPVKVVRYRNDTSWPTLASQEPSNKYEAFADPFPSPFGGLMKGPTKPSPKPGEIPGNAQQDSTPQRIHCINVDSLFNARPVSVTQALPINPSLGPHPLLSDRLFGSINVMPDHPHEGSVMPQEEMDTSDASEYPDSKDGGPKPLPQVIAMAYPKTDPPYVHHKGTTNVVAFPLLAAYDGHRADIGRVVVDSTWHHWVDFNVKPFRAAAIAADATADATANWHKMQSYFLNCAVWLAPPDRQREMLESAVELALIGPGALEEYDGNGATWRLGETARDLLGLFIGPRLLSPLLVTVFPASFAWRVLVLAEKVSPANPEGFENYVLGGIIRATLPFRLALYEARRSGCATDPDMTGRFRRAIRRGAQDGFSEALRLAQAQSKAVEDLLRATAGCVPTERDQQAAD